MLIQYNRAKLILKSFFKCNRWKKQEQFLPYPSFLLKDFDNLFQDASAYYQLMFDSRQQFLS